MSQESRDLKADALDRFKIAHYQRTGVVLTSEEAKAEFKLAREVQIRAARHDMDRRLDHARRKVGASTAKFVSEEGYPDE